MKFCILTLGCKVNSYESDFIKEQFMKAGYLSVSLTESPDIVIVNTCSVTNQSDAKSRHMIRLARRTCPSAILIACGCSTQNHQEKLLDLDVDILLGNKDKSKILELVKSYNKEKIVKFYDMSLVPFEDMALESEQDHTRAFVKIQDGCENFCTYCIIPYLRGTRRSKDINVAYEEIKCLTETGHQEIVLTGIHTGSYGEKTEYDLVDLIREISTIDKLKRIRISSIEITELTPKFMEELKNNPKLCDHMHIPLQSGSDVVLKYMNRKYDLKYFQDTIAKIREIRPDISITTDLIVGFPHETEEEFISTINFIKAIGFTKVHTFPFSLRDGTKAEAMKDFFVDEKIKKERVKQVIELSNQLEQKYYEKFIGKTLEVIVETNKEEGSRGHTSNYILVSIKDKLEPGKSYQVTINQVDSLNVKGTLKQ